MTQYKSEEPETELGETADEEPKEEDNSPNSHGHSHSNLLIKKKTSVSAYLLEFGIVVHSVIIGIALGVEQEEFVPLLIALSFHQLFEGIGLGVSLTNANKDQLLISVILGLVFALTTPTGIAIGIGLSLSTSSPTSQLIAEGVLESIAAGLLVYSSLVTLVSAAFESEKFFKQKHYEKAICFGCFYLGAALMAILAIWAY